MSPPHPALKTERGDGGLVDKGATVVLLQLIQSALM